MERTVPDARSRALKPKSYHPAFRVAIIVAAAILAVAFVLALLVVLTGPGGLLEYKPA